MNNSEANALINELIEDPENFFDSGKSYDLLQCFFNGFSLERLRPLLESNDKFANRVAIWIVSELGKDANALSDSVLRLLESEDRYAKYYSLDALMVFASSSDKSLFRHILSKLTDEDEVIRKHAMFLVSNASDFLLAEGLKQCRQHSEIDHARGLSFLLAKLNKELFEEFKTESSNLLNAYSAIYIKQNINSLPEETWKGIIYGDSSINSFLEDYCQ